MRVNDIILAVRARLHDTGSKKRWSDEELIDSINSALSAITMALNPFTGEWVIELVDGKSKYELPPYFYRLINVVFDGKIIREENIKGFEWVQKNLHCIENEVVVSTDLHHFYIHPPEFNQERVALEKKVTETKDFREKERLLAKKNSIPRDRVVLTYNYEEQIAYLEDTINLPDRFRDAIVFYVMHLAHQSPVREGGDNKSLHYFSLYERQIEKLNAQVSANKHGRKLKSPYIKV